MGPFVVEARMTAPDASLTERLRERAEGCEFATDLALMHQAADALDKAEAIADAAKKYVSSDRFTSDYAAFKAVVEKNQ